MPLSTTGEAGHYEFRTDNVYFFMTSGIQRVRCAVTLQALEVFDPKLKRGGPTQVACFDAHRQEIERSASTKFDMRHTEPDGTVMVRAKDLGPRPNGVFSGGTLTLTFADNEAVKSWLVGQSDDVATVFAARAALRVVPTIKFSPWPGSSRRTTFEIMLRVFRTVATAWAVAAYPGHRDALTKAARAALVGLGDLQAPAPIRAAVYASAAATGDAGTHSRASTVVGYALDAVGSKGRKAFELFLQALATDASLLDERFSPVTLAHSKLWPDPIPDWVGDDWGELCRTLLNQHPDWEVWTTWYDNRLAGLSTDQVLEVARATIDDQIWQQSPQAVNAHIKELIAEREIFQHVTDDSAGEPPDADAIPQQSAAASQFALDSQGLIDLLPDPPLLDTMQRELYHEVRYKALALFALGHNQLAEISEPITRFLAAAPERIEDASVTRLWSRANTLRRRLKAHDTAVTTADPYHPAILSTSVAEMLRDVVESYNVFIVGDPAGRELDQVRLGPQEQDAAKVIVDLAIPIVEAVQASAGLATADATEALVEQVEAARDAPPSVDGDQSLELSRRTTQNFLIALFRGAYARIRAEAGFAWKEARSGTYRYAVPGLIASGQVPQIIGFVVEQANNLKLFVERAFNNPTLLHIIDVISQHVQTMAS